MRNMLKVEKPSGGSMLLEKEGKGIQKLGRKSDGKRLCLVSGNFIDSFIHRTTITCCVNADAPAVKSKARRILTGTSSGRVIFPKFQEKKRFTLFNMPR